MIILLSPTVKEERWRREEGRARVGRAGGEDGEKREWKQGDGWGGASGGKGEDMKEWKSKWRMRRFKRGGEKADGVEGMKEEETRVCGGVERRKGSQERGK